MRGEAGNRLGLIRAFGRFPLSLLRVRKRIGERLKRVVPGFWFVVFGWRHVTKRGILHGFD